MTYFKLSEDAAVLTFIPHGNGTTASFDVGTARSECVGNYTLPPEWSKPGIHICSNIDRKTAAALRDALDEWLRGGPR